MRSSWCQRPGTGKTYLVFAFDVEFDLFTRQGAHSTSTQSVHFFLSGHIFRLQAFHVVQHSGRNESGRAYLICIVLRFALVEGAGVWGVCGGVERFL
jgi:hypothetical protein